MLPNYLPALLVSLVLARPAVATLGEAMRALRTSSLLTAPPPGPYCNGNTTVHCERGASVLNPQAHNPRLASCAGVYAPIQAELIGSAILSFTTGSLVAFERDRAGANTWVVSNEAVVDLTFRCLDAPHSETWVIGLGRNGGSAAGPATSGSGYVYFNNGGKKVGRPRARRVQASHANALSRRQAYHNKDIESHTPGVDAVGGCGGAFRFARA